MFKRTAHFQTFISGLLEPRPRHQGKLSHSTTQSHFDSPATSGALSGTYTSHPDLDQSVKCNICGSILENRFHYQRHMNEFHRECMPYTCSHCQRGFFSKVGLHQHELQHTGQLFSCSWCSSSFTFKRNLKRHIEMLHGIKYCRHCGGTYKVQEAHYHVCSST